MIYHLPWWYLTGISLILVLKGKGYGISHHVILIRDERKTCGDALRVTGTGSRHWKYPHVSLHRGKLGHWLLHINGIIAGFGNISDRKCALIMLMIF